MSASLVRLRGHGPHGRGRRRRSFSWNRVLWSLVYPRRGQRVIPTIPGLVLIALSLGVGMAAYNASSNILFLTLSLLLTCLVLSGILSWMNFRGVGWELQVAPALRVGHDTMARLTVRNTKRLLPVHALWFNLTAHPQAEPGMYRAESTLTARGVDVRAALAQADAAELRGRLDLTVRIDPGESAELAWVFRPRRRGRLRVELVSVGSLFPFGFLRKDVGTSAAAEAVVWPATVEYRRHAPLAGRSHPAGERAVRPGTGSDLIAVRRYASGDSHRLIHWKASARTRQLLVRQFAAESSEGCSVWLRPDAAVWPRPEQFELLVGLAATLAEDLFRAGTLLGVAVGDEAPAPVRRLRDLELFLDRLAVVEPGPAPLAAASGAPPNAVTFAPDGTRGVNAFLHGQLIASV